MWKIKLFFDLKVQNFDNSFLNQEISKSHFVEQLEMQIITKVFKTKTW